jgi:uncharacterized protein (TIGR03435 family)
LPGVIERFLKVPVVDQTGFTEQYSVEFRWKESDGPEGLKQALLNSCGLELVPDRQPVEMLVMEKMK